MLITIAVDSKEVQEVIARGAGAVPRTLAALLNEAAELGEQEAKDAILARVRIPPDVLAKQVHRTQAFEKNSRSAGTTVAEIQIGSQRVSIRNFGAAQTDHGVTYQIATDGDQKVLPHAFGPNIENRLHHGVFARKGKDRLPIVKLSGPSPAGVLERSTDVEQVFAGAVKYLEDRAGSQIEAVFGK